MNKLFIPTILVVVVLVAGIFAFMPVEKASTVHTTIQGTQLNEAGAVIADMFSTDLTGAGSITITSAGGDFLVFCQTSNGVGAGTITIADDGNGGATNVFDIPINATLAIQWAGDAGDTVTISSSVATDGLCTALTTSNGAITFG